jgi:sialate O-acetylesterase
VATSRAHQYRKLFPTMISAWRRHWGQGDFPFLFVQLPSFLDPAGGENGSTWAELREALSQRPGPDPRRPPLRLG